MKKLGRLSEIIPTYIFTKRVKLTFLVSNSNNKCVKKLVRASRKHREHDHGV